MALIPPRAIWRCTWAHPTEPSHRSPPTRLSGIISTKQKSSHIQSSAIHATNAEGVFFFFFPQTGDTCLSLKKDYLRCVSSPPAVALCHLRPTAAFSPPKAVEQTLPSVRSPQPLCAVNFQRSIWLLNASGPKGESNSPIFLRTARIFTVAGAWACRRRLKIFVRGAGQDDAPQIFKMNSALPLLSKQLCPRKSNCFFFCSLKVKCCDWVFYINIRSWQGAFAHWCLS